MNGISINKVKDLKRPSVEFPRKFVPDDIDLTRWESIEPLFNNLFNFNLTSVPEIEDWLLNESELYSAIREEGAHRYIAMTCATDDENARNEYIEFVEKIQPNIQNWGHKLDNRFLNDFPLDGLNNERYGILIRDIKNHFEIFREENIPIDTELAKLSQKYQGVIGAMTVEFQGRERTMQQMAVFLEETDRDLRRRSWELSAQRRLQDRDKIDELFNKMLSLRVKKARNAGFDNYTDYRFRELGRFDYTPADCFEFHDSVEKVVLPAFNEVLARRKEALKLETIRPWDLAVDPLNRPPLKPFEKPDQLIEGCLKVFNRIDPSLGADFKKLIEYGLLDLESRKGKAPGGYQIGLEELRLSFIFMNAVGLNNDVFTLLHEGGHAFHTFAGRDEPLVQYRNAPMEFSEAASMSMELIGAGYLDEFYSEEQTARARKRNLEQILLLLPWIAMIDAFQHWIYGNPEHSIEERNNHWLKLFNRFGGNIDYSGYEDALKWLWQRQLHIFEIPFYYIEYGIAQIGALQVWHNSRSDLRKTIRDYRHGLSLGGSKTLPELYRAAGIKFDFSEQTIKPLIDDIMVEIEKLAEIEGKGE